MTVKELLEKLANYKDDQEIIVHDSNEGVDLEIDDVGGGDNGEVVIFI